VIGRRLLTLLVVLASASVCVAAAASCSSFGTEAPAAPPAEGSVAADGTSAVDGATDAGTVDPTVDAAGCEAPVVLDFVDPAVPPAGFDTSISASGAVLQHSATGGVDGGGALETVLNVPNASSNGPYANIYHHFAVDPTALRLGLSFDFTAPSQPGLYAAAGCELTLRPSAANDTPRTNISTSTNGGGPRVRASSTPPAGNAAETAEAANPAGAFHHLDVVMDVDDTGMGAVVHTKLDGVAADLTIPLPGPPHDVLLRCGFYADSVAGVFTARIDNVRFAVCRSH
jgi:hypothetical protein